MPTVNGIKEDSFKPVIEGLGRQVSQIFCEMRDKKPISQTPPCEMIFFARFLKSRKKLREKVARLNLARRKIGKIHLATKKPARNFARCLREIEFSFHPEEEDIEMEHRILDTAI